MVAGNVTGRGSSGNRHAGGEKRIISICSFDSLLSEYCPYLPFLSSFLSLFFVVVIAVFLFNISFMFFM